MQAHTAGKAASAIYNSQRYIPECAIYFILKLVS